MCDESLRLQGGHKVPLFLKVKRVRCGSEIQVCDLKGLFRFWHLKWLLNNHGLTSFLPNLSIGKCKLLGTHAIYNLFTVPKTIYKS